jgi:hypothetical protein
MSSRRPLALFSMLPLASAVLALGIFSATYFEYFSRHEADLLGSYLPMAIGLGSFFILMYTVTYLGTSAVTVRGRHAKAACAPLSSTVRTPTLSADSSSAHAYDQ